MKESDRGSIDIDADLRSTARSTGASSWSSRPTCRSTCAATYYDEDRGNGTPLQNNNTEAGLLRDGRAARDRRRQRMELAASSETSRTSRAPSPPRRRTGTRRRSPSTSGCRAPRWAARFSGAALRVAPRAGGRRLPLDRGRDARAGLQRGRLPARGAMRAASRSSVGVFVQDVFTPTPQSGDRGRRPRRLLAGLRRLAPRHAAARRHPAQPDLREHRPARRRARAWPRSGTPRRPPTCAPPCTRASACRPSTSCTGSSACGTT